MIGRILAGRYTIVAPIGEGGMSRVWRAQDMNTGKTVAVKVLKEEYHDDEMFVRRFEREALAASRMTHPNIANLLDVGLEADGTRYLVIEYVSGKTLKQFIQESGGAIKPETAAQIILRVLAAVQHAHQNGVIHRDIKPQNILIDKEGTVKVADFGIARVANSQTMNQDTETVMGSVYYFSPEQAKGAVTDEKSDIYSVGAVLYETLTGQVPFTGDTPVAIAMKHLQEAPVPPSQINPAVSSALDFVVLHAMEKRPRNRYASAADMLRDVRLAMEHPDTILAARAEMERLEKEARLKQRRQQRVKRRVLWLRRALVGLFSVLLLAVMGLAGYTITEQVLRARRNTVEVPNVIGMEKVKAYNLLTDAGLTIFYTEGEYPLIPPNYVADQSIAPGTFVAPGTGVSIMISVSKYDLSMPDVTGKTLAETQAILRALGLEVNIHFEASQALEELVIQQDPKPRALVNRGDTVTLTVSGGLVVMPDLTGTTLGDAENKVRAYGLTIGSVTYRQVDDPAKIGKVVSQEPEVFRQIMRNEGVAIVLGSPSSTLYTAEVSFDFSDVPAGGTVTIYVPDEDGKDELQYNRTFEDDGGFPLVVPLYSRTPRGAIYSVYYDGVLKYSGVATFLPKNGA